jgi:hypothetical protein
MPMPPVQRPETYFLLRILLRDKIPNDHDSYLWKFHGLLLMSNSCFPRKSAAVTFSGRTVKVTYSGWMMWSS